MRHNVSSSLSPTVCFLITEWTCERERAQYPILANSRVRTQIFTSHSIKWPGHISLCRRDESYLHHSCAPHMIRGKPNHCLYSYPVTDNVWQSQSLRLLHVVTTVASSRRTTTLRLPWDRLWHHPWSVPIAGLRYERYHNLIPECLTDIQYPWPWDAVIQSAHSIALDALSLSWFPW